ncbi:MAG: type II toxin-antitoxin system RelE/ParE family toxin [Acidobacteriota bacterium]
MAYSVIWHEEALTDLKSLDKQIITKIVERVKNYLTQNPMTLVKPLKGVFKGLFRYRFGDYRIIYAVDMEEKKIIVLHIAHRKDIYK